MSDKATYLNDHQCMEYRRQPSSFNEIVKAVYRDGYHAAWENLSAALAAKDAEIARLRQQLTGTITRIHTFTENHFGNTPVIDLAEHVVSDLCEYRAALSQLSAQEGK